MKVSLLGGGRASTQQTHRFDKEKRPPKGERIHTNIIANPFCFTNCLLANKLKLRFVTAVVKRNFQNSNSLSMENKVCFDISNNLGKYEEKAIRKNRTNTFESF